MTEAVTCPHCHNDVADAILCSVCCHSLGQGACSCLYCAAGIVASDRSIAMLLIEAVKSASDDWETARNLGACPTITEATAERVQRALAALEG